MRSVPSCHGNYQVHHHEENTLEPVRLSVRDEVVYLSLLAVTFPRVSASGTHTNSTETKSRITWKASKYNVCTQVSIDRHGRGRCHCTMLSSPMHHPMTMINGSTSNAICILDPTATPIARSILSLQATVTAVACSAALPTIGSRIKPTKVSEMPPRSVMASMESTYRRWLASS